ncbi:MAG: chemotaxis response regulator protein-glutamate methylesterase [Acidobacteria bacterium]|nr:MAG: chemotaxis response regulator protein-glutamate methylesterase [Acidobacteriota bacterium]RLE36449.1 MAG: chemotaxis response regulator protein-glutamate methylesterase [Acidobacteriota bacterium]
MPAPDSARTKIRVLVVDDSSFMQREITAILEAEGDMQVVGTAADGLEAIQARKALEPDVITMDINMPRLDGLEASRWIMAHCPAPIVIVSSYAPRNSLAAIEALEFGVIEVVEKPSGPVTLDLDRVRTDLVRYVRTASRIRVVRNASRMDSMPSFEKPPEQPLTEKPSAPPLPLETSSLPIIAVAASTGGPVAVRALLQGLDHKLNAAIVVCQHMPPRFTREFAIRLNEVTPFTVCEAEDRMVTNPGSVLVAPGGFHLELNGRETRIREGQPVNGARPSADLLFRSIACTTGRRAIGVVLTGMGEDGARGAIAIRENGGIVLAQDEESSVVFGMPAAAARMDAVDEVLPLESMPPALTGLVDHLNSLEAS